MAFEDYQKIFPLLPHDTTMNFYPPPSRHPSQQQQLQQRMMNPEFFNPFFLGHPPQSFMVGNRQQQQNHHHRNNHFRLPSTTPFFDPPASMPSMTQSNPPSFTSSSNGSVKEETPREVFFRTLSASLKAANKRFCGKTTTWKNPFLYKTNLCVNYSRRTYCRFGVNCWYAHGTHELRCIPESEELPEPAFIIQYLSFLGLPLPYLNQIIQEAYCIANLHRNFLKNSPTSSLPTSSGSPTSNPTPPIINNDIIPVTDQMNTPKRNATNFYSSIASNGGWADIESALKNVIGNDETFGKGFQLFGNNDSCYDPHKP